MFHKHMSSFHLFLGSGNSDVNSFLNEALIMKDFNHPNVLSLIGISLENGEFPVVILPFMANGDLLSYIRNERNVSFSINDLIINTVHLKIIYRIYD